MYDCVFQSNAKWLHNREINLHQDRSCKSFFVKELCTICGASFPRNCVFVGDEKKGKSKNKIRIINKSKSPIKADIWGLTKSNARETKTPGARNGVKLIY